MKIENADRLRRKLEKYSKWPQSAKSTVGKAVRDSAQIVVNTQKSFVPVKSGDLKNSIKYTMGKFTPDNANVRGVTIGSEGDPELTAIISAGDAKAYYAAWVEFGTAAHIAGGKFKGAENPGAKPSPYFFPGYRLNKKRVKARIARATKKAVQDLAK